ncbi:myb-like protein D [Anopheles merus]|nr:myb-like protein D [Anopheles merus]
MNNKDARTSRTQYQQMVDELEKVPDIARGMYKGDQTAFWEEMAEHLNALGPPIRTGATWKRVWFDYKCAVKKKLRVNKASLLATGGGPFQQRPLNDVEERVANLTNLKATIEGNSGRSWGNLNNNYDNNNNNNNNNNSNNNNSSNNSSQLLPIGNNEEPNSGSGAPNNGSETPNNEEQNPITAKARQKRSRKRQNTEAVLRQNQQLLNLMKENIEAQK